LLVSGNGSLRFISHILTIGILFCHNIWYMYKKYIFLQMWLVDREYTSYLTCFDLSWPSSEIIFDNNFKDMRSSYRHMYCEYVQCFQLMLMTPLMVTKTGQHMQGNLCIHNELVIWRNIYFLHTFISQYSVLAF
jgi:hypothetical protein